MLKCKNRVKGGNFPNNTFSFNSNTAWSVSLNPDKYTVNSKNDLTVTLRSTASGKSRTFRGNYSPSLTGAYFNYDLDAGNYMFTPTIIFRPNGVGQYNGEYTVSISGIKNKSGQAVDFNYRVNFFNPANVSAEPIEPAPAPGTVNISLTNRFTGMDNDSEWGNGQDKYIPRTISYQLLANGQPTGSVQTFSNPFGGNKNWDDQASRSVPAKDANGNAINLSSAISRFSSRMPHTSAGTSISQMSAAQTAVLISTGSPSAWTAKAGRSSAAEAGQTTAPSKRRNSHPF